MTKELGRKPRIAKHYRLQWEQAQDIYVLLYPEGVIQLNESAGAILSLCDGNKTLLDIIAKLKEEFGDDVANEDVLSFIEEAEEYKWISYE